MHACMKEDPRTLEITISSRFRSASFLPTVLSLRVVGQITGFRCARARGTLFGGANNERGRQRKRVREDTEYRKEGERRNKTEKERVRERSWEKRSIGNIPRDYVRRGGSRFLRVPRSCIAIREIAHAGGTDAIINKQTNRGSRL